MRRRGQLPFDARIFWGRRARGSGAGATRPGAQANLVAAAEPAPAPPKGLQVLRPLADSPAPVAGGYREASIAADHVGQFQADFLINGVSVHGMIDTGATFVSLTPSTAERLGLLVNRAGQHYQMHTANGLANAWPVTLNNISFQGLYVPKCKRSSARMKSAANCSAKAS